MKIIVLDRKDCAWAIKIGSMRRYESLLSDYTDNRQLHYESMKTKMWFDVNGAGGELAACRALGVEWSASVNEPDTPDIILGEKKIDVKTPAEHHKRLLIPDIPEIHERLDWWYLHVTGEMPEYYVWGAIKVRDAMKIGIYENPNNRGPAWFVRHEDLTKKF